MRWACVWLGRQLWGWACTGIVNPYCLSNFLKASSHLFSGESLISQIHIHLEVGIRRQGHRSEKWCLVVSFHASSPSAAGSFTKEDTRVLYMVESVDIWHMNFWKFHGSMKMLNQIRMVVVFFSSQALIQIHISSSKTAFVCTFL